jgi:hypothetical protein
LPEALHIRLPEHDTTLSPTWAVKELAGLRKRSIFQASSRGPHSLSANTLPMFFPMHISGKIGFRSSAVTY